MHTFNKIIVSSVIFLLFPQCFVFLFFWYVLTIQGHHSFRWKGPVLPFVCVGGLAPSCHHADTGKEGRHRIFQWTGKESEGHAWDHVKTGACRRGSFSPADPLRSLTLLHYLLAGWQAQGPFSGHGIIALHGWRPSWLPRFLTRAKRKVLEKESGSCQGGKQWQDPRVKPFPPLSFSLFLVAPSCRAWHSGPLELPGPWTDGAPSPVSANYLFLQPKLS